ncbi:cell division protein ZapE [Frateuria aurantia]
MTDRVSSDLSPSLRYAQGADAGEWERDPVQLSVLPEFDRIYQACQEIPAPRPGLLGRLQRAIARSPAQIPGLYLWGSVGRGKTFLMDLLVASLPDGQVIRRHYHRFMGEIQDRLRELDGQRDPLLQVADGIAARCRVLCLDEFLVNDIGDAMILAGLLQALIERGVTLVTTSNTAPANLYKDGLQRARFLPAIALLEAHCHVVEMVSSRDWRLRALQQAKVYLSPADSTAEQALERIFASQATGDIEQGGSIEILGRPIRLRKQSSGMLWFDFPALCEGPRSVADYIALAKASPEVILASVPVFDPSMDDAARRFISLIDEFYDRHVKLVISAAAPITGLYQGERLQAEFARTQSRLIEMQSEAYMDLPHRVD